MRVKILIFPLVLLIVTVVSIWVIKPLFSEALAQKATLKEKEAILQKEIEKGQNMESLKTELQGRSNDKQLAEMFISPVLDEEKIVHYLNSLAVESELWVLGVDIEKEKSDKKSRTATAAVSQAELLSTEQAAGSGSLLSGDVIEIPDFEDLSEKFKTTDVNVIFSASGKYEKIRNFLTRLNTVTRFNGVESVEIARIESEGEEGEGGAADDADPFLQATINLNFPYLEKVKESAGIPASFVAQGEFNDEALANIRESLEAVVNDLSVESVGKTNPFSR